MDDPQVWTLIGLFGTQTVLLCSVVFAMLRANNRALESRMDGLGQRMDGLDKRMDGLDKRMDGLDTRIETTEANLIERMDRRFATMTEVMDVRFTDVDHRLSNLEGDMRLVKEHLIGQRSA